MGEMEMEREKEEEEEKVGGRWDKVELFSLAHFT